MRLGGICPGTLAPSASERSLSISISSLAWARWPGSGVHLPLISGLIFRSRFPALPRGPCLRTRSARRLIAASSAPCANTARSVRRVHVHRQHMLRGRLLGQGGSLVTRGATQLPLHSFHYLLTSSCVGVAWRTHLPWQLLWRLPWHLPWRLSSHLPVGAMARAAPLHSDAPRADEAPRHRRASIFVPRGAANEAGSRACRWPQMEALDCAGLTLSALRRH